MPAICPYIMPSKPGIPPRAILVTLSDEQIAAMGEEPMWSENDKIVGPVATWQQDSGFWAVDGQPVVAQLDAYLSEACRSLGIDL